MFKRNIIFLLLVFLFGGCITHEISNCSTRLQFSYTYNKSGQNKIEQVRDIWVYVFDNHDVLHAILQASEQDIANRYINLPLPNSTYTAVLWGSSSNDMLREDYRAVEATNTVAHAFEDVKIGRTKLAHFTKKLFSYTLPQEIEGDVAPQKESFADLFYATIQDFTVKNGRNQSFQANFMKNTSTLKVKVTGLQYVESATRTAAPLQLFVTAKNERYGSDNQIDSHSRMVRYESSNHQVSTSEMSANVKVQRLVIDTHTTHPVQLHLQHPQLGEALMTPLDVLQAILVTEDNFGNKLWQTQEAIDKEDEFSIEISILVDLSVSVSINEFEIINTNPNLKPKAAIN